MDSGINSSFTVPEIIFHAQVIEYIYDGLQRRVGKKVDGILTQSFIYQSQTQIAAELDGLGNLVRRYVYASKPNTPDYFIQSGKEYRIISDHQGEGPPFTKPILTVEIQFS